MRDVCIDTAGVFAGILIVLAIVSIYIALKKDNENNKIRKLDYIKKTYTKTP